jgi:hypothetical protein
MFPVPQDSFVAQAMLLPIIQSRVAFEVINNRVVLMGSF